MCPGLLNVKVRNENKRTCVIIDKGACLTLIISHWSAKKMNLESFIIFLVHA